MIKYDILLSMNDEQGGEMKIFQNVIKYSLRLKRGESVFIFADNESKDYTIQLYNELLENGNVPFLVWNDIPFNNMLIETKNKNIDSKLYDIIEKSIENCDAAIMLDNNIEDYSDYNSDDVIMFKNNYYLKIFQRIMKFKKWVYLRYPSEKLANLFNLSYDEHLKLLVDVNNFNYNKLYKKAEKLKNLLDKTEEIRILGKDTDLTFTKNNINSVICCGNINLPDGEVYTAPNKFSVNGKIYFDVDSYFRGKIYKDIKLTVKNGKIIKFSCNLPEELNKILQSDEGASYFGEFAFGLNPYITKNYNDNLFNEKMARTIHLAIGCAHADSPNGNVSIIHWDLIKTMYENCSIYFDGQLIYKDGEFILPELKDIYEV